MTFPSGDDTYELLALRETAVANPGELVTRIVMLNIAAVLGTFLFEDLLFLVFATVYNVFQAALVAVLQLRRVQNTLRQAILIYGLGMVLLAVVIASAVYCWFTKSHVGKLFGLMLLLGAMLNYLTLRLSLRITSYIEIATIGFGIFVLIAGTLWVNEGGSKSVAISFGLTCCLWYFLQAALSGMRVQRDLDHLRAQEVQRARTEAIGQLAGGVAHDFNNLLTVILGNLELRRELLQQGGSWIEAERLVIETDNAAQRAAQTTRHLLTYSRKAALEETPTSLNALCNDIAPLLRRTLPKNVVLDVRTHERVPKVMVDPNQLENVLINLVVNARDAMPNGGKITVSVTFSGARNGGGASVVLSVHDTGEGIEPHLIDKVQEPFFTTKPTGKGSGLGLSMAKGFAEQSGGRLELNSQKHSGTKVQLSFPALSIA